MVYEEECSGLDQKGYFGPQSQNKDLPFICGPTRNYPDILLHEVFSLSPDTEVNVSTLF